MSKTSPAAYTDLRVANATLDAAEDRAEEAERREASTLTRADRAESALAERTRERDGAWEEVGHLRSRCEGWMKAMTQANIEIASLRSRATAAEARLQEVTGALAANDLGAGYSEDDLRAEGIDFGSWEKGFTAALEAVRARALPATPATTTTNPSNEGDAR